MTRYDALMAAIGACVLIGRNARRTPRCSATVLEQARLRTCVRAGADAGAGSEFHCEE